MARYEASGLPLIPCRMDERHRMPVQFIEIRNQSPEKRNTIPQRQIEALQEFDATVIIPGVLMLIEMRTS